jgi:REP element-mobilizing transposase RayT
MAPLEAGELDLVIAAISEARNELGFQLCGFVLMPDHWHALIGPAHPLTISRVVQDIKWTAARSVNRRRDTVGPVWQHQFWDRFVRTAKEFHQRLDYMHWNPCPEGVDRAPRELDVVEL